MTGLSASNPGVLRIDSRGGWVTTAMQWGWRIWLVGLLAPTLLEQAEAHWSSDSFLTIAVTNGAVQLRWEIAMRDLDMVLGLDDNGDGKGTSEDGALARTVAFGTAPLPSDPRVAGLVVERRALEGQVDALRRRKSTMDSTAYERELERLLVEIATRSAAIRAATGQKP